MRNLRWPAVLCAGVLAAGMLVSSPVVAQEPGSREARAQAAEVNAQLAMAYMREGNLAAAREKIDKALQQNPKTANTQMVAGFIYDRLNEKRKATSHYDQAARLGKDNPDVLNNAAVYFCRNGQYKRGEELLLQAAASPLYRTPEVAYANAGRCAKAGGRTAEAEQHFRKALSINARQPDALLQMAEISQAGGNGLQARAFLERYSAVAQPTSASLWLGRTIELGLGDTAQAARYAQRIKDEFPTSTEAAQLFEAERAAP